MEVSGDPTDTSIKLRPLEPASGQALARDLVLKTRRRKGLGEQIAVSKYLDDEFVVSGFDSKKAFVVDFSRSLRCLLQDTRTCLDSSVCTVYCSVVNEVNSGKIPEIRTRVP
jgi:hypothetical protein